MRKPYQHRLSECFPIYKITGENRGTKEMHVVIESSQGPRTIPSLLQESSFCALTVSHLILPFSKRKIAPFFILTRTKTVL